MFYDYEAKYNSNAKTQHIIPVDLSKKNYKKIMDIAFKAHKLIGCKGVTRSDFKFYKNKFYLLEINTQPGMTNLSLVPEIANYYGINFIKLINLILKDAKSKSKKILLYFFIFLLIGSLNNKNFEFINFFKVDKIIVTGLDKESNNELYENLNFLRNNNLFFLSKSKIKDILSSNSLIEKYFIFKRYPSTLDIKVHQTEFLAKMIKKNENFYLGSNGKLTKIIDLVLTFQLYLVIFQIKVFLN